MEFYPGIGVVHRGHHPGQTQTQGGQAAIEIGVVQVGVQDVRPDFLQEAPHRRGQPPGGGVFEIQAQGVHRIAGGRELRPHRAGSLETGHLGGKAPGRQAPDDGRHQILGAPHRQAGQQVHDLEGPLRQWALLSLH